jgi:hypothetical protein
MRKRTTRNRWSSEVTRSSHALDLEPAVFKGSASQIARSLKRSAERSKRRKTTPFRSALSMITFYENRAGAKLPAARKRALERAKDELRKLYGRPPRGRPAGPAGPARPARPARQRRRASRVR